MIKILCATKKISAAQTYMSTLYIYINVCVYVKLFEIAKKNNN